MSGIVYLVGAGPGDPELMTLKAARVLGRADVVLVDDLVGRGCLAHARSDARVIEVGKRAGCASTPQAFIEKLMVLHARQGQTVVRLKGGDPLVFGRGGEEIGALLAAGISVEVVPGITAGTGAPATLGIPVTHRELARAVTFVTGHTTDAAEPDWKALAASGATLVIYMGLRNLAAIRGALLRSGMDPRTPVCIIENGTTPSQRQAVGTLDRLSSEGFCGPAIVVIGTVVGLARKDCMEKQAEAA